MIETRKQIDWTKLRENLSTFWGSKLPKDAYITPKMPFKKTCRVFLSELSKGDIYCEFIDKDGTFFYPDRRLYKLPYDVNFSKRYSLIDGETTQYQVNLTDFILVENTPGKVLNVDPPSAMRIVENDQDYPSVLELNVLDLYALMHNKPISTNAVINNLINKNK